MGPPGMLYWVRFGGVGWGVVCGVVEGGRGGGGGGGVVLLGDRCFHSQMPLHLDRYDIGDTVGCCTELGEKN